MSERAPYSRVYWSIIDDPKFVEVYDDDRALSCWLRLLLVADQAWPASASLPITVRRSAYDLLVRVGLVDPQPGGRYRIHGLDTERGERRAAATRQRTGRDPVGTQVGTSRDPDGSRTPGRRRDETRQAETSTPRAVDVAWETASGRTLLASGNYAFGYIDDATSRHGERSVIDAIARARSAFPHVPETNALASAVKRILDPFPDAKAIDTEMRAQAEAARSRRGTDNTKRQIHGSGFHADTPDPLCPECAGRVA